MVQAAGSDHGGVVDRGHLAGEEGLRLIPGIDAVHHRKHEVQFLLGRNLARSRHIGQLSKQSTGELKIARAKSVGQEGVADCLVRGGPRKC